MVAVMVSTVRKPQKLSRDLRSGQIFMIGISGILGGVIIVSTSGEVLAIAGPAGVLTAFAAVGLVAIAIMEGLSEMIELWPVSNAMMEFVKHFVDPDLAVVVGIAYWYSYASIFATLIISTVEFARYWHLTQVWQILAFFIFCPLLLLGINGAGVKYYGYIECFGGAIKMVFVFGGIILLYVLAGKGHHDYLEDGFRINTSMANNVATAVCLALPVMAYGFLGVEIIAVTAFEARNPRALRFPAKWIAYVVFVLEFLFILGEVLAVGWEDPDLSPLEERGLAQIIKRYIEQDTKPYFVLAAFEAGTKSLPGFLSGCVIFCVLSSANTALYVASRTLFGLTREIQPNHDLFLMRWLARLGTVTPRTHVPAWALLVSVLSFCWLPLLYSKYKDHYQVVSGGPLSCIMRTDTEIQLIVTLSQIGAMGCLLVWASQCLAFIRYRKWSVSTQFLTAAPSLRYYTLTITGLRYIRRTSPACSKGTTVGPLPVTKINSRVFYPTSSLQ